MESAVQIKLLVVKMTRKGFARHLVAVQVVAKLQKGLNLVYLGQVRRQIIIHQQAGFELE